MFQRHSAWADGPLYVTQCPIRPGQSYTYKFDIVGQEGTLWWHAHASWLRATVYGALIVRPRPSSQPYPFPQPYAEVPILLGMASEIAALIMANSWTSSFHLLPRCNHVAGEWWNADVVAVDTTAQVTGGLPNVSDAFMVNGKPGDRYPCSSQGEPLTLCSIFHLTLVEAVEKSHHVPAPSNLQTCTH